MNKLACIALLIATASLAGCCGDNCPGDFEANCCGWDFYKPCDLIEGKRADCAPDPCAGAEIIVHDAPAAEAPAEMPAAPEPVVEDAPAAPADG
ncbi:MAG: hypothetical protein QNJ90_10590 [Planctomycetota bacterium]|nr:hypothetical protein [Planctomycetota bacterium]